jgi:hypothetical protein
VNRVRWSSQTRRWVFDWHGISEFEARKHGFRGLPRAVRAELTAVAAERRREERMAKLAEKEAAKIAEKAARKAASRERLRIRNKRYFRVWYSINKGAPAARRKAQRALLRNAPNLSEATDLSRERDAELPVPVAAAPGERVDGEVVGTFVDGSFQPVRAPLPSDAILDPTPELARQHNLALNASRSPPAPKAGRFRHSLNAEVAEITAKARRKFEERERRRDQMITVPREWFWQVAQGLLERLNGAQYAQLEKDLKAIVERERRLKGG